MNNITRLLTMKPTDTVVDKFGGATFTIEDITRMVSEMMQVDDKATVDAFLERFVDESQVTKT